MNIYLATSWRNEHYDRVLEMLRGNGYNVYNFREKDFRFDQIADKAVNELPLLERLKLLSHPKSEAAFKADMGGLMNSDTLIMLHPCGNDAHAELGWAAGMGMTTIIYVAEGYELGLMDKMASFFVTTDQQLLERLRS